MFFRQYQLGCLSLFSYLVGDEESGRAVVVDPQRDIDQYLHDAEAKGMRIERVIETHFHADFVSGHLELAAAMGAAISYGDVATADFEIDGLADGQRLSLGASVELQIRHTPGHTPESISIVVLEHGEPWGVLTGDTLFIGDVGRPDLLVSGGWSKDELARRLYQSLHSQLLTLPDACRVFPAHGAGSACGKNMSAATESTIGEQRRTNYALVSMSEDEFVDVVTEGQSVAPLYFGFAAEANRHVHELLDDHEPPVELGVARVVSLQAAGAIVLDARSPEAFASGHLRGAVNVGIDGRFAEYAGDVVRAGQPIVLVTDAGRETEARVRLARIGFDTVVGCLVDVDAVLAVHPELASSAVRLPASEVAALLSSSPSSSLSPPLQVVDVRNPGETEAGVIDGAALVPLARLLDGLEGLDRDAATVVYCAGGYRSSIAASLLRAHGFATVADVLGGYGAWASLAYR